MAESERKFLLVDKFVPALQDGKYPEAGPWLRLYKLAVAGAEKPRSDDESDAAFKTRQEAAYRRLLPQVVHQDVIGVLATRGALDGAWEAVEAGLLASYGRNYAVGEALADLRKRTQVQGESVSEFTRAFLILCNAAKVTWDGEAVSYLNHLLPEILAELPLDAEPKTGAEVEKLALRAEAKLAHVRREAASRVPVPSSVAAPLEASTAQSSTLPVMWTQPRRAPTCWFCGALGHVYKECRKFDKAGRPAELPHKPGANSRSALSSRSSYTQPMNVLSTASPGVQLPAIAATVGSGCLHLVMDTGAACSLMAWEAAQSLGLAVDPGDAPPLLAVNGTAVPSTGRVSAPVCLRGSGRSLCWTVSFTVVPSLPVAAVLGWTDMLRAQLLVDAAQSTVGWPGGSARLASGLVGPACAPALVATPAVTETHARPQPGSRQGQPPVGAAPGPSVKLKNHRGVVHAASPPVHGATNAHGQLQADVADICRELKAVFSTPSQEFGAARVTPVSLAVRGDPRPVAVPCRRTSPLERAVWTAKLKQLVAAGKVEPSASPWAARGRLVSKSAGTAKSASGQDPDSFRLVFDFGPVNDHIDLDAYPSPDARLLLERLDGMSYFSKLDLSAAFLAVPIATESRHLLAFNTPDGRHLQFTHLPFGLNVAPKVLQRLLDEVLAGIDGVHVYADDVLIASRTVDEHREAVREVLTRLLAQGWLVKGSKCLWAQPEVPFLGRLVGVEGVRVDPAGVAELQRMPAPRDKSELRSLLGALQWVAPFVKGFAGLAQPLRNLLADRAPFLWGDPQRGAFAAIKSALSRPPVLAHPNLDMPWQLEADASGRGWGAVLLQGGRPVAYASRAWQPAEQHLPITQQELLALLFACREWRHLIEGGRVEATTDHRALQWLTTLQDAPGRLGQWAAELAEFGLSIKFIPGDRQGLADPLSRLIAAALPVPDANEFAAAQRRDTWCSGLLRRLADGDKELRSSYVVNEVGVLCIVKHRFDQPLLLPCVPAGLVSVILTALHDAEGHPGRDATLSAAGLSFHWPSLRADVEAFTASCTSCAVSKPPARRNRPPMGTLSTSKPHQVVAVDVLGSLGPSTGAQYVLTIVDHFSRFIVAVPMMTKSSAACADAFRRGWLQQFGAPDAVLTDQGPEFAGAEFSALMSGAGIEKRWTTPYRPQADGVAERANGIIVAGLRLSSSVVPWTARIKRVVDTHNLRVNAATGLSPREVLAQRLLPSAVAAPLGGGPSSTQAAQQAAARRAIRKAARSATAIKQRNANEAAAWSGQRWCRCGAQVWARNLTAMAQPGSKTTPPYDGPWVIAARPSRWTAVLARGALRKTVNVSTLKQFAARPAHLNVRTPTTQAQGAQAEEQALARMRAAQQEQPAAIAAPVESVQVAGADERASFAAPPSPPRELRPASAPPSPNAQPSLDGRPRSNSSSIAEPAASSPPQPNFPEPLSLTSARLRPRKPVNYKSLHSGSTSS